MLPAFERRFFDLRLDLIETSQVAAFASYFAILDYQSDSFWEFASEILFKNFDGLTEDEQIEVVRAFGKVRRGSDTLWRQFFSQLAPKESVDVISRNAAIIRAMLEVGFSRTEEFVKDINTNDLVEKIQQAGVIKVLTPE